MQSADVCNTACLELQRYALYVQKTLSWPGPVMARTSENTIVFACSAWYVSNNLVVKLECMGGLFDMYEHAYKVQILY